MKIAFICIHNSCRSQMAEAWANELFAERADFFSAGTEDYPEIKPDVLTVFNEVGVDLVANGQYPKVLANIPKTMDIIITMGCGVDCPNLPANYREDWGLTDPSGGSIADFRKTRDEIKEKVIALMDKIKTNNVTSTDS